VFLSIAEPRARIAAIPGAALGGRGCFVYLRMMRAQRAARLAVPPSAP